MPGFSGKVSELALKQCMCEVKRQPNTACTRRVGVAAFSGSFPGSSKFRQSGVISSGPPRTITNYDEATLYRSRSFDVFTLTASRMSAFSAASLTASPSKKSMARTVLLSRRVLKSFFRILHLSAFGEGQPHGALTCPGGRCQGERICYADYSSMRPNRDT